MDTFSNAHFKIDAPESHGGGDTVTIPDAHLLFSGDYARSGADLIVSDQLHRVVVPNYFHGDKRPALVAPNGAPLDPGVIEALTGHVQYAQAAGGAAAAAAKVVGHVVKMTGSASVVRNGVTITLNNGDNVLQNDVVQTGSGSSVGLVMIDGTTFNLSAGARLMLNDLTYDAGSTANSSLFTLVQGAASFVAGQVAKTGDMKVGTPVATMGIRGTAVILDISAVDGRVSISVVDQRDGQIHAVQVFNTQGLLIGTVTSNGSTLTLTPVTNFEVIAQESNKTVAQVAQEFNAFQTLLQTYDVGRQLFPNLPEHTDANPQSPTRYASSTPGDSPNTERTSFTTGPGGVQLAADTGTPVQVVINPTGSAPGGSSTPAADPILIPVNIPATPLPFVVTPSTVSLISGDGDHFGPVMSADGQYIVYDPDGTIFLYDRQTNTTITVAEAGGGFTYSGQTISADGHHIVFQGTDGTQSWVFIYNSDPSDVAHYRQTVQLVAGGAPAISGDGSTIVVEHGGNGIGVYDQQGHVLATITPAAIGETGSVWLPAISADGHMVAFWNTDASAPGGSGHLLVYDLSTGNVTEIASTATDAGTSAASFSADGRYVVYQSDAPGGHSEIYLYDLSTGQVVFHTENASGASYNPVLSPDGNFIIFASDARLLPDGDTNAVTDIYIVDLTDRNNPLYRLVSNLGNGTQPDAASNLGAAISAGGLFVAFGSAASNLAPGDAPGTGDIFVVDSTSGRSVIIRESANSPDVLTASGVIALAGDHTGITLSVVDPTGRFTASFNADGDIEWHFSESRSDFASLLPGQIAIQNFAVRLDNGDAATTIPVRVSVYDADQPEIAVVANPGTIAGDNGDNTLTGTAANDILQGFGGDDAIIGLDGIDRAVYTDATGGITVDLAAGTVTGEGVGADTLDGIEAIQGSNHIDHYSAVGFTGVSGVPGVPAGFNTFEGMAGDDIITGTVNIQGQALTRISYASATAAVTVDLAAGTAAGDASVGSDHFTDVSTVIGSRFGDTLSGSDNPNGSFEQFDGRGGNDSIDGRGGYDFATYNNDAATHSGITVNLAAGSVVGDASIGSDTLRGVEGVRGTHFADTYNAAGFNGGSINAGSSGSFNNFDGQDGDDSIFGNGSTRIQYSQSTAAVLVDLADTGAGGTGLARDLADAINLTSLDLASVGVDTIHGGVNAVMGSMFGDRLLGSGNNETFQGLAGNDFINGRGGFDIAQYNNMTWTTGGISVDFANGIVTGDASNGTDTLRSIEGVQGTNFDDIFDATNYAAPGYLDPSLFNVGNNGTFNQFEGMAGDDDITGNGNTRVVYFNAAAGVTVDIEDGTADGDASVGHDTFTGVSGVTGGNFADILLGSNNAPGTVEQFEGRGGDDILDGRGGFDQATYSNDPNTTTGITVDMFAGTVDGDDVGHDTLISIESVIGSRFGDVYDAVNFVGFNEFQGLGGNDQITGNGQTQLGYYNATSGVTVDMALGTADGDASVGHDTFSGVNQIRGSNSGDTFHGDAGGNILDGLGGGDLLDGRAGTDMLIGGGGADTFVFAAGYGADTVADFNRAEGDRIDLTGVPGIHSLADVQAIAVTEAGNTLIDFGDGDTLELIGVTTLLESDFIFDVNDAPVFTGDNLAVSYTGAAVPIVTNVSASDVDSDSYNGGSLTATVTDGGHEGDTLSIAESDYIQLSASGNIVSFDSDGDGGPAGFVEIGTLTDNFNSLTVALNGNATDDAVARLTQAIQFENSKPETEAGTRTVTFTLNDGGGTANGGHDSDYFTATVDVTAPAVNNAPVVTVETPDNHVLSSTNGYVPGRSVDQTMQLAGLGISGDADVTVEFWANFGDDVLQIPVGFQLYDVLVGDFLNFGRAIGFNTGNGDVFGIARGDLIGQWHHYAVVFHNGDATQSQLYIDGESQTLTQLASFPWNPSAVITDDLQIGGWGYDSTYSLDGQMDDLRIYHGALTASDIAADMQGTITGPQPGLVAAYTFENVSDGPGGVADASGNGHNATLLTLTAAANVIVDPSLPQTVSEDQPLVFSGANQNAITVSDLDGDGLSVTLTVAHGAITLVAGSGALVTGGADGTATVTISGSAAAINAALDGLSYHPDQNYHGADALAVTASDGQLDHAQTINLAVNPVNDAPTFGASGVIAMVGRAADDGVGGTSGMVTPGSPVSELAGQSFSFEVRSQFAGSLDSDDFNMLIFPAAADMFPGTDQGLTVGYRGDVQGGAFTFGFWGDDLNFGDSVTSNADVGHWVTWAGTYDAGTNTRRLYKDGVLVAEDTASGDYNGTGNITIGTSVDYDRYFDFNGAIDYARIYSGVLSAAEIADHAGGAASTGDLLDYEFNETSGATAIDSSPSGNDGTIANASRLGAPTFLQDGNGVGVAVAAGVSVFDPDDANFSGGTLSVEITGGLHSGDLLSIENGSTIFVLGGVYYDADGTGSGYPVVIGAVSGSSTDTHLTINLNDQASAAAVAALTEAFRFSSSSTDQTGDTRQVTFTLDDGAGGGSSTDSFIASVTVIPDTNGNAAPVVTGDMAVVAVTGGGEVALTVADLGAVDPDTEPGNLTFTIDHLNHGILTFGAERLQLGVDDTFTLADVQAGDVYYQSVGSYVGQDHIRLSLSDNVEGAPTATAILGATVVNAQFTVLTADGYDFDQDDPVGAMGSGTIDPLSESGTTFTIVATDGRHFIVTGTGFEFQYEENTNSDRVTLGTITSITELGPLAGAVRPELARFDLHVSAPAWYDGVVAAAAGDNSQMEALTSPWTFNFVGNAGADAFFAADVNDIFTGRAGNDTLGGEFGYDRANYGGSTGPIDVQLADGIVTGDGSVGTDALQSIELVTGSNFADTFDATGFNSTSANAGSTVTNNVAGMFNEFEGRGGADTITGNGQTRVSYYHATAGVVVVFNAETSWATAASGASGSATGDASVGADGFTGVNHVRGTFFNDTFTGSSNPNQTAENFEGLGGDDFIDGGAGFDRAHYFQAADDTGITVDLEAGTVTGGIDTGADTLRSIEAIWGTNFADIYDATGFSGSSLNAGNAGNNGAASSFNEFEGGGGDDLVTGNGNTRVAFSHATGGVVVTLDPGTGGAGTTGAGAAAGNDTVGNDTFISGVTRVRGSEFNDIISGNGAANVLEGQGGNDIIHGRSGGDTLSGGTGADIFVFETGSGADTVMDFNRNQGDRLDLRGYDFSSYGANTGFMFFSLNVSNPIGSGNTLITIGSDTILLLGVPSGEFGISDIIFGDTVAVSVQTPDGYDFSTVYDGLAAGYAGLATGTFAGANTDTRMFIVDAAHGLTFELTGTGLTYNGEYLPEEGTITEINILDTTNPADPAQLTQDHVLVNSNGWSIDAASLTYYLGQYSGPETYSFGLEGLDSIFGAATYSYVGSGGFADNHSQPRAGADVFLGGNHADVFNGMPGPFGEMDPGSDTVDYSHAAAVDAETGLGIIADLAAPANNTGAAAGDTYISIENLRGSDFNDTLTGDGNNNVIEGGFGDDVLDGGANGIGVDTVSYEHATDGVSVSLVAAGGQQTGGAGFDTLTNFEGLRGSNFNDILTGNGNSVLEGGAGDDHLIGHAGQSGVTASYEHAGSGVTVDLSTSNPQDTGGAGADTLTNIANLTGSQFNDVLTGDSGNNIMFGNGGNDTFVFNQDLGVGQDTIGDFMTGQDRLDLQATDVPTDYASFATWLSTHATTPIGTNDTLIDLDADLSSQNTILLRNVSLASLSANDFILPAGVVGG